MVKQWKRSLTGDDVQAEAEDALEKDIADMSPASNSVAANLDGGVEAVDWSSKTPEITDGEADVDGSGYLIGVSVYGTDAFRDVDVEIDGTTTSIQIENAGYFTIPLLHRFDTSMSVSAADPEVETVTYLLD